MIFFAILAQLHSISMDQYTSRMQQGWYQVFYWIVTVVCVAVHFILGFFCYVTPNPKKNHRRLARWFIQRIAQSMQLRVSIDGLHHLPKKEGFIIMANHTSLIDILVLTMAIPVHFNFIAKKELAWVPIIGLDMLLGGDILIDRSNSSRAKATLKKVEARLKKGWNILIFPEGTRSTTGSLLPFKRGGFKLALATGCPIVPCYIDGSDRIVQKKSLRAQPGTVHLRFAPPILPSEDASNVDTIRKQTFAIIDGLKPNQSVND